MSAAEGEGDHLCDAVDLVIRAEEHHDGQQPWLRRYLHAILLPPLQSKKKNIHEHVSTPACWFLLPHLGIACPPAHLGRTSEHIACFSARALRCRVLGASDRVTGSPTSGLFSLRSARAPACLRPPRLTRHRRRRSGQLPPPPPCHNLGPATMS